MDSDLGDRQFWNVNCSVRKGIAKNNARPKLIRVRNGNVGWGDLAATGCFAPKFDEWLASQIRFEVF